MALVACENANWSDYAYGQKRKNLLLIVAGQEHGNMKVRYITI